MRIDRVKLIAEMARRDERKKVVQQSEKKMEVLR